MSDGEYAVGFGKPPKEGRFKPGQSGNPKGRRKKSGDVDVLLERELAQPVVIQEYGGTRRITKREAVLKQVVNKAMKGDTWATDQVLKFLRTRAKPQDVEVDSADLKALEVLMGQWARKEEKNDGSTDTCDQADVPDKSK